MPLYLGSISRLASQLNHGMTMGVQGSIIGAATAVAAFIATPLLNYALGAPFLVAASLMLILYLRFCRKSALIKNEQ